MRSVIRRLLIASALSLCLCCCAFADLAEQVNAIVSSQKNVRFSIRIVKAESGVTVYQHNANRALLPASNMKIIISSSALKFLGPDYQYVTRVGLIGNTLVVVGSGDPLFGDRINDAKYGRQSNWMFDNIKAELKRKEETINNIIIDTGVFDNQCVHPSWPQKELNRWYACEISGLNFNDNCIEISAQNSEGQVEISIEPQTGFIQVVNEVKLTSQAPQAIGSYRTAEANRIIVFGNCKDKAGPFVVAVEKPAAFFGFLLAENLAKAGINISGQIVEQAAVDQNDMTLLTEFRTPIADCLARCNKDSLGLAAESLLKTIAADGNPDKRGGSWSRGRSIIERYLLDLGIDKNEFAIDDGSGLSEKNRLSANAITTVLLDVYKSENWPVYKNSLAVGGVDGTIDRYFGEQKYKGKIFGKTGYISGVKSFSGVCITGNGDYIFSIIANNDNSQTRQAINNIAEAIIDSYQ